MKPDRKNFHVVVALALLGAIAFCPAQIVPASDYPPVCGPCNLSFPRDHASHPDYRIEWWYYTGNLRSEDGAGYGFQLTFFRIRTVPAQKESVSSGRQSAWRTRQVFAAHAALSDISANEFFHSEKMSRAALELAGAKQEDGRFEVFVNGWKAAIAPGVHNLSARAADFSFNLDLVPLKSPVAHGESGLSSKGEEPGEASCYYSISRLEAVGKVTVGGREKPVRGTAWMDHEFMSAPLNPRFAGWDWFGLQFSDGSELMVYLMREKNGGVQPGIERDIRGQGRESHPAIFQGLSRPGPRDLEESPFGGALSGFMADGGRSTRSADKCYSEYGRPGDANPRQHADNLLGRKRQGRRRRGAGQGRSGRRLRRTDRV